MYKYTENVRVIYHILELVVLKRVFKLISI